MSQTSTEDLSEEIKMSYERPRLLILSHDVLFHSENSASIQAKLISLINKGYDKPRYQYNVIKTSRIVNSLAEDLGIKDEKDAIIGICVHHDINWSKDHEIVFGPDDIDVSIVDDPSFEITDSLFKQIIGSIGIKPHHEQTSDEEDREFGMELTALTSFYPGLGATLIELIQRYIKAQLPSKKQKLHATVIEEHNLVPFYEKLGFKVQDRIEVVIDPTTGRQMGRGLEDGLLASRSFNLASMYKNISTTLSN